MANALYAKGKQRMLSAAINFATDTIKVALVSGSYAPSLSTDEFYSSVAPFVLGSPVTLTNKSVANGAFDADDVVFPSLPAGNTAAYVVMFKATGLDSTSPLIALIDSITGFPVVTNGGDVIIQWDNGVNKIFSL